MKLSITPLKTCRHCQVELWINAPFPCFSAKSSPIFDLCVHIIWLQPSYVMHISSLYKSIFDNDYYAHLLVLLCTKIFFYKQHSAILQKYETSSMHFASKLLQRTREKRPKGGQGINVEGDILPLCHGNTKASQTWLVWKNRYPKAIQGHFTMVQDPKLLLHNLRELL